MPHLTGDITIGNLITILITALSAAYAGGKLTGVLTALTQKVTEMQADFKQHQEQDREAFALIHEKLIEIALRHGRSPSSTGDT
jgi:hypothetical protein